MSGNHRAIGDRIQSKEMVSKHSLKRNQQTELHQLSLRCKLLINSTSYTNLVILLLLHYAHLKTESSFTLSQRT